jgi:hypothetical protein
MLKYQDLCCVKQLYTSVVDVTKIVLKFHSALIGCLHTSAIYGEQWTWQEDSGYYRQLKCFHPFASSYLGFVLQLGMLRIEISMDKYYN